MRLRDLRNVFTCDTNFVVCVYNYDADKEVFLTITNLLWGCTAFSSMEILPESVSINCYGDVIIRTDMPYGVFMEWKNYSEKGV